MADIFSPIMSGLALLVSAGSFYYQFFHKRDVVSCTLTGYDADSVSTRVQLVLGNGGNRAILLRSANLRLLLPSTSGGMFTTDDPDSNPSPAPVLIPSNQLITLSLNFHLTRGQMECIAQWHDDGHVVGGDGFWPYYVRLIFVTVSGRELITEEKVLSVHRTGDAVRYAPRAKPTWRIGGLPIEDCVVI